MRSGIYTTVDRNAEDIVQDVALKILSRPTEALPIDNIGGFVYRAIKNKIVAILRCKEQRIDHSQSVDELWQEFTEPFLCI